MSSTITTPSARPLRHAGDSEAARTRRAQRTRRLRLLGIWAAALVAMVWSLGPFLWTLKTSVVPEGDIFARPLEYLPREVTFEHYQVIFERLGFLGYFLNTFIVAAGSTLLGLGVSISASYAFARFDFAGRRLFMGMFLVIPMFPSVLLLIPIYDVMRAIGLVNTYWAMIIAYCTFAIPFATWMLAGYLRALPREIEEAARVDGCTRLGAFFRVLFPAAAPGIAATGLYIFIVSWNEYVFAVTLAQDEAVRTLPVALQLFISEFTVNWGMLSAGGVVVALPVIVLFVLLQRYLVSGLTAGAVK